MHPISLASDADSDDNTDVDGKKNPNRNTIEEFTEEIKISSTCPKNVVSVFGSHEPFAWCGAPFF